MAVGWGVTFEGFYECSSYRLSHLFRINYRSPTGYNIFHGYTIYPGGCSGLLQFQTIGLKNGTNVFAQNNIENLM
jgi:hypothetical protein